MINSPLNHKIFMIKIIFSFKILIENKSQFLIIFGGLVMHSKELIERVEELAKVYSKVIASLDSKERKIEMFESYYKILMTLQNIQTLETIQREGFRK
jgi:hypothetical protein